MSRTYHPMAVSMGITALLALTALAGAWPVRADTSFTQTGASMWGPFEAYWKAHGGLAQFGMARTGVYPAGSNYDAQWFERALFTYTPSNPEPYKVQLQLLGSILTANRRNEDPFKRTGGGSGQAPRQYFEQTGHNLSGKFYEYWKAHGGLPIFGYPISDPFMERSRSDGNMYEVQYFERNRFELHPEKAGTPYEVQLGLLGSEMLDAQGGPSAFSRLGAPRFYPASSTGGGSATVTPAAYPKFGHAPDYSWVAGQVQFTRIQGGCVYIRADGEQFVPGGQGWDRAKVNDGDFVVVFGHIAGPGEPFEICPGGRPYIIDRYVPNP